LGLVTSGDACWGGGGLAVEEVLSANVPVARAMDFRIVDAPNSYSRLYRTDDFGVCNAITFAGCARGDTQWA